MRICSVVVRKLMNHQQVTQGFSYQNERVFLKNYENITYIQRNEKLSDTTECIMVQVKIKTNRYAHFCQEFTLCLPKSLLITEIMQTFCIQNLCKMCATDVYKMYTKCIQNVSHISRIFWIHFVYKIKRTTAAKFCIQNVYKSLSKCGIQFVYIL